MSASHAPVKEPHGVFGHPWTPLGSRALRLLGWSVALLLAVVVESFVVEDVAGRGHHAGLVFDALNVAWYAGFFASLGCVVASAVAAVIAIVRRGERALVVYLSLVPVALLLLVFLHPLFIND